MNPRNEPLLWLQLVALGAIPLELLLLLLLLAGADPGPLPALERSLAWGLGGLAPSLLLWRRPADCGSLLVVQVPAGGRTPLLRHLNTLQQGWLPKILLPFGAALLLAVLWIVDSRAALAAPLSPVDGASRLVTLMLAVPILAVLLWQWQQVGQALWLLSRSPQQVEEQGSGRSVAFTDSSVLSLGLPVLLLPPFAVAAPNQGQDQISPPSKTSSEGSGIQSPAPEPSELPATATATDSSAGASLVAIEPEQASEESEGDDLDQDVD